MEQPKLFWAAFFIVNPIVIFALCLQRNYKT